MLAAQHCFVLSPKAEVFIAQLQLLVGLLQYISYPTLVGASSSDAGVTEAVLEQLCSALRERHACSLLLS